MGTKNSYYEWLLLRGDPVDQLASASARFDFDLLVINRCHSSVLLDWFKGSTLDRLFRDIRATTLVA